MTVGKIYPSYMEYIDRTTRSIKYKSRPVLIIAEPIGAFDTEYTVLPVSTISVKKYYNHEYDVSLKVINYPLLSITKDCYVRTHKQTTVYRSEIDFNKCIGDLKMDYPNTFYEILEKLHKYEENIIISA